MPLFAGLFLALIVLLIWLPLPIGSNRPWSQGLMAMIALTLCGLWASAYALSPFESPPALRALKLPGVVLGAWALYPVLQLVPLPLSFVESIRGPLNGVDLLFADTGKPSLTSLSIDPGATIGGLLSQLAIVSIFFLVVALTTSEIRLRMILRALFGVGLAEAFYGLMLRFADSSLGLWDPGHMKSAVSGTYVNQNHFAGLMEVTIPVTIGLLLVEQQITPPSHKTQRMLDRLVEFILGWRGILTFALAIMVPALVMTASRGAILSLTAALIVGSFLQIRRWNMSVPLIRNTALLSGVIVLSLAWLGTGSLVEKFEKVGIESDRADLRDISYRMVKDNPVVGTGVGTYRWAFPVYKDERFGSGFYEHAHNDYLEILGEQGVIGFGLFLCAIIMFLSRIGLSLIRHRDPCVRGVLFASFTGCLALLLHGLVDFNLQIPANAAYFFTLLAIGVIAPHLETFSADG